MCLNQFPPWKVRCGVAMLMKQKVVMAWNTWQELVEQLKHQQDSNPVSEHLHEA